MVSRHDYFVGAFAKKVPALEKPAPPSPPPTNDDEKAVFSPFTNEWTVRVIKAKAVKPAVSAAGSDDIKCPADAFCEKSSAPSLSARKAATTITTATTIKKQHVSAGIKALVSRHTLCASFGEATPKKTACLGAIRKQKAPPSVFYRPTKRATAPSGTRLIHSNIDNGLQRVDAKITKRVGKARLPGQKRFLQHRGPNATFTEIIGAPKVLFEAAAGMEGERKAMK